MDWVVDASFAAAIFLPDEHTERADRFFDTISEQDHVFVPHLWWNEISNVLVTAVRRKRISVQKGGEIYIWLEQLPVITVEIFSYRAVFDSAITYQLSGYDATYLTLAVEQKAALASFDQTLNKAARSLGLKVI